MKTFRLKDVNGNVREIPEHEVTQIFLDPGFMLMGLKLADMVELKCQYDMRSQEPINRDAIKRAFSP